MVDFYIKQNDTDPIIQATLSTAATDVISSVKFWMADQYGNLKVNGATATIVQQPSTSQQGIVSYSWATGDTDTAGKYKAEFEVTFNDGRIETYPNSKYLHIEVVADIANMPSSPPPLGSTFVQSIDGSSGVLTGITVGRYRPEDYGGKGDGVADDTTAVQDAINAAVSNNGICWLTGEYNCTAGLSAPANMWMHLALRSTRLIKNYVGGSLIQSAGYATLTKANDIRITGPGKLGAASTSMTGHILNIYGDRFVFLQTGIDTWGGATAMWGGGDNWLSFGNRIIGSDGAIGSGGWRYVAGNHSRFIGMHVESGDDALQFVPSANASDALFNLSISDSWYESCTGQSVSARFMVAALVAPNDPGALTCSVTNCGFRDCSGLGGFRGIYVYNKDSTGNIINLTFEGCAVDMSASTGTAQDVLIERDASGSLGSGVGLVRSVKFIDLTVSNSKATASIIQTSGAVESVEIVRPNLQATSTLGISLIDLSSSLHSRVEYGLLDCNNQTIVGIIGGSGSATTYDMSVTGTRIIGIANSKFGINMNLVAGALVMGCSFEEYSGATTAKAWRTGASTTGARVIANNLNGLSYTDSATGTVNQYNI